MLVYKVIDFLSLSLYRLTQCDTTLLSHKLYQIFTQNLMKFYYQTTMLSNQNKIYFDGLDNVFFNFALIRFM